MKKRERPAEAGSYPWIDNTCDLLKGSVLAGVAAILILLLCAVLISGGLLSERWLEGSVLSACVVSAMLGGLYAGRRIKKHSFMVGIGVGAVLFLLLLTAGLFAYRGMPSEQGGLSILSACLCGGAIAGIFGRKPKKKRRR